MNGGVHGWIYACDGQRVVSGAIHVWLPPHLNSPL
jgi:hypothetical protein